PPPILPLLLTCFWSCVRPPLHSFPTRRSSDLISQASFVACHQFPFIDRIDVLSAAEPGATFLLNAPFGQEEIWSHLPRQVQQTIIDKKLKFYLIDAYGVAREAGMGSRINTIKIGRAHV